MTSTFIVGTGQASTIMPRSKARRPRKSTAPQLRTNNPAGTGEEVSLDTTALPGVLHTPPSWDAVLRRAPENIARILLHQHPAQRVRAVRHSGMSEFGRPRQD
jgi:hypothetical protein